MINEEMQLLGHIEEAYSAAKVPVSMKNDWVINDHYKKQLRILMIRSCLFLYSHFITYSNRSSLLTPMDLSSSALLF